MTSTATFSQKGGLRPSEGEFGPRSKAYEGPHGDFGVPRASLAFRSSPAGAHKVRPWTPRPKCSNWNDNVCLGGSRIATASPKFEPQKLASNSNWWQKLGMQRDSFAASSGGRLCSASLLS
jgi:hypothetical protein